MQTEVRLKQFHPEYARIIQITDTHIRANSGDKFDGVDTRLSLQEVLQHARDNAGQFDAMVVSGDLVHDPVDEAYAALADQLREIPLPVFCIPGNHDDPALMKQHLDFGNISTAGLVSFDHWQLVLLDSWLPGTHAGKLAKTELRFLENALSASNGKSTLVFLHHPPVSINSPWMDKMALKNPADLFPVLEQYNDQVKAVIWGHIHQEFSAMHGNIRLLATPSTCVQFKPGANVYEKDTRAPGYRILNLFNSGVIETGIIRVADTGRKTD